MKICIEDQAFTEERVLAFERLFDLDHHVDQIPDVGSVVDEAGARINVLIVCKARADSRTLLDGDMVAGGNIGFDVVRREAYAELIVLDLFNASDLHSGVSFLFVMI